MNLSFHSRVNQALEFLETHPGGRNRRLTAEEGKEGGSPPWVSVAMNFDSRIDAEEWTSAHIDINLDFEREGNHYSDALGYYKAEYPWGLVYAHFPKVI
jgi:hypothetical protein